MANPISVGLEIHTERVRSVFETILASQPDVRLHNPDDADVPQLVVLEMDADRQQAFARVSALQSASPATDIFLTSASTDADILLQALRAGVKEFFPQPIKREEVERALETFRQRRNTSPAAPSKRGRLINVMGSKGGIGTTTIAVNLAISLQEANPSSSVVLVDLNPQFGDAALFLNIEPLHTFGDIARNITRLDDAFLRDVLSRHPSGLYLLPSAHVVEEIGLLTPEIVEQTLDLLRASFDYIILDSGHVLDDITIATLHLEPTLFLVCTLALPVLRNTRRLLEILSSNLDLTTENIRIIVNRYKSKKQEISLYDFEDVIEQKAFWMIPNDYYTTLKSIDRGEPVSSISRHSRIAKSFKKFAMRISTDEKKKTSFLSRLKLHKGGR
jgi:pilus assembly protein CpaE